MADGRKKNNAARIHSTREPAPACAAAETQRRLTTAETLKRTRSRKRSSRREFCVSDWADCESARHLSNISVDFRLRRQTISLKNDLIECVQQLFAGRIGTRNIRTRLDTGLRELDNVPILAVSHVPKVDGIVSNEIFLCQFS